MMFKRIKKDLISLYVIYILIAVGFLYILDLGWFIDNDCVQATNTYIVDINNNGNFTSIQAAVDNASDRDTIYVWAGTYYENIIINKSLTIIGNNSLNTTINGGEKGDVVNITANWVNITGFNINNSGKEWEPNYDSGIELNEVNSVHIYELNCSNNYNGITLINSNDIIIEDCKFNKNLYGNLFYNSSNVSVKNNTFNYLIFRNCLQNTFFNNNLSSISIVNSKLIKIINNTCIRDPYFGGIWIRTSKSLIIENNKMISRGLYLLGDKIEEWNTHTITTNNTVNGKPIYYWTNKSGGAIPSGAGQVILVNCTNVIVENQNLSNVDVSIELIHSNNNILKNNICNSNTLLGIYVFNSTLNNITNNTCSNINGYGIQLIISRFNVIINNTCNSNNVIGITLENSDSNILINNNCSNNWRGIGIDRSNNYQIMNNTCNSNDQMGLNIENSNLNDIENNTCNFNVQNGIRIYNSSNCKIKNNNLSNNQNGIFIIISNYNQIIENIISYNSNLGISIELSKVSNYNYIYHNNIISNAQQASNNGINYWNNSNQEGNYWSDYTGQDNGANSRVSGDGIGDTNIPHLGLDYFPFIKPNGWLYPGDPVLLDPGTLSIDGNYSLSWNQNVRTIGYILQEDRNFIFDSPKEIYNGSELSYKVFGKPNGTYYYRLMAYSELNNWKWSNIVNITVDFPPEPPQNLSVSVNPAGNILNLSWKVNLIDTMEYEIYYRNLTFNSWKLLDTILHPGNTYNHSRLIDGEMYFYKILARDFRGQKSESSSVVEAIPKDTLAPTPPSGLEAKAISDSEIKLSWNANYESDIAEYNIYINNTNQGSNGSYHLNQTVNSQTTSVIISGLTEQITYYFKMQALDEVPNNSSFSKFVFASPPDVTIPEPPKNLNITNATYKNLTITWDVSFERDVIGYNLFRSLSASGLYLKINTELLNKTHYIDGNLNETTTYYYKVTAVDDANFESSLSKFTFGTTLLGPYPPEINHSINDFEIIEDYYDDQSINLYHWFKDRNRDPLNFRYEGQNYINVTIFQSNGTVILQPRKDWNGEETLTFYCSDGVKEIYDNVTIIVTFVNDPPTHVQIIHPKDYIKIFEKEPLNFESIADDPDLIYGDKISFKWSSNIIGELGTDRNLTDIYLGIGKHLVTLEVTDSYGASTIAKVRITVIDQPELKKNGNLNYILAISVVVSILVIISIIILFLQFRRKKSKNEGKEPKIITDQTISIQSEIQLKQIDEPFESPQSEADKKKLLDNTHLTQNTPDVESDIPSDEIQDKFQQQINQIEPGTINQSIHSMTSSDTEDTGFITTEKTLAESAFDSQEPLEEHLDKVISEIKSGGDLVHTPIDVIKKPSLNSIDKSSDILE